MIVIFHCITLAGTIYWAPFYLPGVHLGALHLYLLILIKTLPGSSVSPVMCGLQVLLMTDSFVDCTQERILVSMKGPPGIVHALPESCIILVSEIPSPGLVCGRPSS